MARKKKKDIREEQKKELIHWITIVILCAFAIIGMLRSGVVGNFLYQLQRYIFGSLFWLVVILIAGCMLYNIFQKKSDKPLFSYVALGLIVAGILLICSYIDTDPETTGLSVILDYCNDTALFFSENSPEKAGGGLIGMFLYSIFSLMLGRKGVIVTIIVLFVLSLLIGGSIEFYKNVFMQIVDFFRLPEREEEEEPEPEPEEPQEPRNLWNMLEKRKEKRMIDSVKLSDEPEDSYETSILTKEEKPKVRKMVNIKADGAKEEIPVVSIPGKVISSKKSVFINVDDLMKKDSIEQEETYEYEPEPESYYEPPEEFEEHEPVYEPVYQPAHVRQPVEQTVTQPAVQTNQQPAPKQKHRNGPYRLPKMNLLDPLPPKDANSANEISAKEKGELLINILANFDIEAKLLDTHIGPSVTQFEIRPDANVKISRINSLTDNIKMQLAARDIRIEAPIPGRNAVGVEIPNIKSTPVKMRELVNDFQDKKSPLLFFVGKDLLGRTVTCRLDKMPHLLIAGATGSGKSVCMNSIITSILLRTDPEDVKMLLIDPKKVEFTPYQKIPHLIGPVINDPNKANNALKVIVRIMDERYNIFSHAGVRNIETFNEKVKAQNGQPNPDGSPCPKKMPYIIVIIDELADLMTVAGKEVEQSIQRITQLARAAGIHLIVATQRPSVDVITGVIKANIPSRIAFAVSSGMDSRTILDHVGAERLLGNGDMLYMPIGQNAAMRVQGVFVTDDEVKRITDYVSEQASPMYDDAFVLLEGVEGNEDGAVIGVADDPLYEEIKEYVVEAQKASTSLLQRRFGIGYNRAARMIDCLEQNGVIGPANGSKPREVFLKKED